MIISRKYAGCLYLLPVLSILLFSAACSSPKTVINTGPDGIAIKGYDTVAYFTDGGPVKGDPLFEYKWKGARWLFSSKENMELFIKAPEKYAPRYGGY